MQNTDRDRIEEVFNHEENEDDAMAINSFKKEEFVGITVLSIMENRPVDYHYDQH